MQLTPRAESLRAPLANALNQVRGLFVADAFDPATSERRFSIMMPDHVTDLLVPSLLARISKEAPGIRLHIAPWRAHTMTAELARSVDLVIACLPDGLPGFRRQSLFADTEAIAVRRGHPVGKRLKRIDTFLKSRHVAVAARGEDPMDVWLNTQGIVREIALTVPSYLQALHVISKSDLVAFVPLRLIEALAGPLSLLKVEPPVDPGVYEEFLFYPARSEADQASIWLRSQVLAVGRKLDRRAS